MCTKEREDDLIIIYMNTMDTIAMNIDYLPGTKE
jgi:hypothetical protein